ncbi:hypothetical protein TRFO_08870 [Tritrichomonas foetus]|uniref:UBX domain-containing protein n=1 Tax=Tritrichomonas foetus TaxID=1144522 RepID=A0A1J4JJQ0_9EUKA|nr:hypothetical protein TRFO_08870 [Tritrichomonas foetus]|eukprot:OHS98575.1 hypothetical protein TRFO_08870 [Tritrichomonas foetus]
MTINIHSKAGMAKLVRRYGEINEMNPDETYFKNIFCNLSSTPNENDKKCQPFADGTNFLNDVVSFISIELFDGTRIYHWFSPDATLNDLYLFITSNLSDKNNNFILVDKDIKDKKHFIRFDECSKSKNLREFLVPINQKSTRNRFSFLMKKQLFNFG